MTMQRSFRFVALTLGLLWNANATACHRISPSGPLEHYSAIFLGVVTGIRLHGLENRLLGRGDFVLDGQPLTITNGASPVSVTTVATLSVRGSPESPVTVRLVGCTFALPALNERGLFFVQPGGESAVTVWESDAPQFSRWLDQLGIPLDAH